MLENTINKVTPKSADSRMERLLLGFIELQARRVGFGKIVMEFTIHNNKVKMIRSREVEQTFNVEG